MHTFERQVAKLEPLPTPPCIREVHDDRAPGLCSAIGPMKDGVARLDASGLRIAFRGFPCSPGIDRECTSYSQGRWPPAPGNSGGLGGVLHSVPPGGRRPIPPPAARSSAPADPSCCRLDCRFQLGHDTCAAVGDDPPQFNQRRVAGGVENMPLAVHDPFQLAEIILTERPVGALQGVRSSAGTTRL